MTNEEAIVIMENERPHCGRRITFTEEEKCEAYEMAIAALKAEPCVRLKLDGMLEDAYEHGYQQARYDYEVQPCEDAISRQAILKLPKKTIKNYFGEVVGDVVSIEDIKALPPVTPTSWTHVSEDLPKESGEYLVSVIDEYDENYEAVGVARYDVEENEWQGLGVDRTVIAWNHKPAPYKEGESE